MKSSSIIVLILVGVLMLAQGCYRSNAHQSLTHNVSPIDTAPKLLADYQPWFGDPEHISVGYSTQDPAVLKKQIHKAKELGIYAFAVDWYGDRRPFLDRSYSLLQQIANENHFHVALMYDETEEDNGRATDDALEAFEKAYKSYIGPSAPHRDAYLQYQGRPVIFIFPKRGHTDWDRVRQQLNGWEAPPWLIFKDDPPEQYAKDFDGQYAWIHPGPKGWATDGSEWGKEYLESFYTKMRQSHPDQLTVGGVWPGFDDSKASWGLNRHVDRRCGQTLEDTLAVARHYENGTIHMPFLMIATWNDYEEGTAIENGVAHCNQQQASTHTVGSLK
jgi:hypothetical protein